MNILVIGAGGREHALVCKLAESPRVTRIFCAPGNPGIAAQAECIDLDMADNDALCSFALKNRIDLTIVGPEAPLMNGVVEHFAANGLRIFGPTSLAAQIEGFKVLCKRPYAKISYSFSRLRRLFV